MGWFFQWLYEPVMAPQEVLGLRRLRRRVVAQARGRVLEVGAGGGPNLPFYPPGTEAVLSEPEPAMAQRALERARRLGLPVQVVQADAQALPFAEGSFDTVVSTLVFCTVPDPMAGLREVRRVLRPGGALLFIEHVRGRPGPLAAFQDAISPLWRRVTGGCHPNRNTLRVLQEAGFQVHLRGQHLLGILLEAEASPSPGGARAEVKGAV